MKMKIGRFKIFFLIPTIYILFISFFMAVIFMGMSSGKPSDGMMFGMMGIIIPLHFFSMFCIFHTLYFSAKTLKSVEMQRIATFSDYAGEFFLLWFFPIGIWVIQPRLNKLIEEIENKNTPR